MKIAENKAGLEFVAWLVQDDTALFKGAQGYYLADQNEYPFDREEPANRLLEGEPLLVDDEGNAYCMLQSEWLEENPIPIPQEEDKYSHQMTLYEAAKLFQHVPLGVRAEGQFAAFLKLWMMRRNM